MKEKRILRLSFLLLVKEGYLLGRNLYGLLVHPFLTLKRIKREKDRSQFFLLLLVLFSLLGAGGGIIITTLILTLIFPSWKNLLWLVGGALSLFFLFSFLFLGSWLGYWLFQVKKSE